MLVVICCRFSPSGETTIPFLFAALACEDVGDEDHQDNEDNDGEC